tara:strand:- start:1079 stop:1321 length:243 start_codon:yes stop_codon:yes gene_type:complete
MLFIIKEIQFEPYCQEVQEAINGGNALDFASSDTIVDSLEDHYNIKIHSIIWHNVAKQTDCDGYVSDTPNLSCGLISGII